MTDTFYFMKDTRLVAYMEFAVQHTNSSCTQLFPFYQHHFLHCHWQVQWHLHFFLYEATMDFVHFNSFFLSSHISFILSQCFSLLSSVQLAPLFFWGFSWKPLEGTFINIICIPQKVIFCALCIV